MKPLPQQHFVLTPICRRAQNFWAAVNAEHDDSYLQEVSNERDSTLRVFRAGPELAKLFDTPAEADKIVVDLAYPAYIVAIFEIDDTYAVIPIGGDAASSFGCRPN